MIDGQHGVGAEARARQADRQVDKTAAELEDNIDQAAEQTQAVIGAVGERVEGIIEDAPRQTANVVQSVSNLHSVLLHVNWLCFRLRSARAVVMQQWAMMLVHLRLYPGSLAELRRSLEGCKDEVFAGQSSCSMV